ncbi:cytochrome P450 [Mycobacterium shinjukuense]|uniref:Putative cytochrome P450 135A1 n=1 Tax=Mycobacterium shinjukuense TaxID=398694 RepID=A0A7I7MUR6_9MYCO|nr:cytochrome P450 [Mycobacterium shinjukuense]MCV6986250.1 cytochrome P450 [Mycobacterium shinjukuense]ORB72234.1 cytochrome P450 [Mycobacterium shinjukuense]BBX75253.1 putative cytochrome P450 135A1 [Mycobacterium shinjukuense]
MTATLPPGPRLPRYVQSVLYLKFREWFLPAMHRRYGDVFSLRVPPYADNLVVYTRPEHIKEIFAADPRTLHAGEGNQILGFVMGEHSVLMTDEAEHSRIRSLLMPAFTRAALRGYRDMIESVAREHIARWPVGANVTALDCMNALTLDVILRVVFGVTDPKVKAELTSRLQDIINIHPMILAGLPYPVLKHVNPWKRFFDNQHRIDDILYHEIASRRAISDLAARADVLSRLLQTRDTSTTALTDAELRDQLITLLLAGHETTAAALSWTLWELAQAPDIQGQVVSAAVDGDDAFLEAVLKEGMRRHTVIASTARKLTTPTEIGGWRLPAGTVVNTSILLAHANEEAHPNPTEFRPSRFLDGSVAPNTWLPFGGGVRRCLGVGFALTEGVVILREIFRRFTITAAGPNSRETPLVRNITTVPKHGAQLRLTPQCDRATV